MKTTLIYFAVALALCPLSLRSQEFLSLGEIYDYNKSDEFHSIHYYCCNDISFQLRQVTILEKQFTQAGLVYICELNVFDYINTSPPILSDTTAFHQKDTLIISHPDSIIFTAEDEIIEDPDLYNGRKVCINYSSIVNSIRIEQYAEGCGLVLVGWKEYFGTSCWITDSLVYFKKGMEEWGNSLLSTPTHKESLQFTFNPNPLSKSLILHLKKDNIKIVNILIMDTKGSLLGKIDYQSSNYSKEIKIDCTDLPAGIYFLYLSTDKGYGVEKFIKM